jgi:hypothetical protein
VLNSARRSKTTVVGKYSEFGRTWSRVLTIARNVSSVATLTLKMRVFVNTDFQEQYRWFDLSHKKRVDIPGLEGKEHLELLQSRWSHKVLVRS